jgi:DNA polymerase I-like protein with 3'-5' exonuclease and polymerase domains
LAQHHLIYHNAKFDTLMLQAGLRGKEGRRFRLPRLVDRIYWDTQVMCLVLWPWESSRLKDTAERLWGEVERDTQRKLHQWLKAHGMRFDLAPWSLLAPYATKDAELTLRLALVQFLALREQELYTVFQGHEIAEREVALASVLTKMESRGVGWDTTLALDEAARLARLELTLATDICEIIRSTAPAITCSPATLTEDTIRRFWFSDEGLDRFPVQVTSEGTPSVAKDVVDTLIRSDVPAAREWSNLSKVTNARSMWYKGWSILAGPPDQHWHGDTPSAARPPRLRTSFNQGRTMFDDKGGTISGRLAVARWQAQAKPHAYQLPTDLFDPPLVSVDALLRTDPGYVAVELDLSQVEFRVAAAISGCVTMVEAFKRGLDVHDETTLRMFNIDRSAADWNFKRNVAKRCGLGMIYGAGVQTIGRQIEKFTGEWVAEEEIAKWVNEYNSVYPEFKRSARAVERAAERKGMVRLAGGRMRWFGPGEQFHKAFNQKIQGGVAEMMKAAMVEVEREVPGCLLLQVHDSLVCEFPILLAADSTRAVSSIMTGTFEREFGVPFRADAKVWASPDGDVDQYEWIVKEPF